jgi:uncharacterized protein (TIGR03435 family)
MFIHSRETPQVSCYELVTSNNGHNLIESDGEAPAFCHASNATSGRASDDFPPLDRPGMAMPMGMAPGARKPSVYLRARAQPISELAESELARIISEQVGCPVVDNTGLTSKYDYTLEFVQDVGGSCGASPGLDTSPDDSGPGIASAIQNQLGLSLMRARAGSDMLIINSANRIPVEN